MVVSGEDQDYSVANCGSIRERNRQAALAFRKRDVYYVNQLQARLSDVIVHVMTDCVESRRRWMLLRIRIKS